MAYMQKYPTSTKAQDLLASSALPSLDAAATDGERFETGEDQFAWPPPSASSIGASRLIHK